MHTFPSTWGYGENLNVTCRFFTPLKSKVKLFGCQVGFAIGGAEESIL